MHKICQHCHGLVLGNKPLCSVCYDSQRLATLSDIRDFRSPDALRDALDNHWVRFVRASYLLELREMEQPIVRHQELPEEVFVSTADVLQAMRSDQPPRVISYRWLTPEHPDPQGHHLNVVALMGIPPSTPIFWDFLSLPQPPRETGSSEDSRFRKALSLMHILYAHEGTRVYLQTRMPDDHAGNYLDSGWCTFESSVSSILKSQARRVDIGGDDFYSARVPPMIPSRFSQVLDTKTFTNGQDAQMVKLLYETTFYAVANSADTLIFSESGWGPLEAEVLAEALPSFTKVRILILSENHLGHQGVQNIASALAKMESLVGVGLEDCECDEQIALSILREAGLGERVTLSF